jgi:pimeloyl-ACP methyl ester carboxylesterase
MALASAERVRPRRSIVLAVTLLSMAACSGGGSDGGGPDESSASSKRTAATTSTAPDAPDPGPVEWTRCPGIREEVECGVIEVPMDYADPSGEQIEIAVSRVSASGAQPSLGALVLNPGGPGVSGRNLGIELLYGAEGSPTQKAMLERFDLIGFDPRGVGGSTQVDCGPTAALDEADYSPETPAERTALEDTMQEFAEACDRQVGPLLEFVGTGEAARDVDQIRRALGEDQVSLFGFSYGTELFAEYADLFPDRVRAAVLDGAAVPARSGVTFFEEQAAGLEEQFAGFVTDCAGDDTCPVADTGAQSAYDTLAEELGDDQAPTSSQLATVAATALFGPEGRAFLRSLLATEVDDARVPVSEFYDLYTSDPGTNYASAAIVAINCADYTWPEPEEMFDQVVDEMQADHPRLGEAFAREYLPCAFWPHEGVERPIATAKGSAPILVVGTTGDPATPYPGAVKLADSLDNGTLLTRDGTDHTAWGRSDCIDEAIAGYLVDGDPPPPDTTCPSND